MTKINTAWDHVSQNLFKTWVIMFFFSIFAVAVIYAISMGFGRGEIGGLGLTGMALIMAGVMNFVSYFWSDKIVLGILALSVVAKMNNA